MIVGSSNLTQGALTKNVEWNTSLRISYDDEYAINLLQEFDSLWKVARPYNEIRTSYKLQYDKCKEYLSRIT